MTRTGSAERVLFISHTADQGTFKVGSHHLARELSDLGYEVAHVSTPLSLLHGLPGLSNRISSLAGASTRDVHGTVHLVPRTILPVQLAQNRQRLAKSLSALGFRNPDYVFIDQPLMNGVMDLFAPMTKIIYRPTDTYLHGMAARRQVRILRRVEAVVATSAPVLESLRLPASVPSTIIENGVELRRFDFVSDAPRSGIAYIGAVDYRFDWNSIKAIANFIPHERVDIYGPVTSKPPAMPSNVVVHGPIDYGNIPTLLTQAKIGIIPLNNAQANAGRSPMKFYEYLAAGLYVIASRTPELDRRAVDGVRLYSSEQELINAVKLFTASRSPNDAGKQVARSQEWSVKAKNLMSFVQSI